jgi:hypothetical protein
MRSFATVAMQCLRLKKLGSGKPRQEPLQRQFSDKKLRLSRFKPRIDAALQ